MVFQPRARKQSPCEVTAQAPGLGLGAGLNGPRPSQFRPQRKVNCVGAEAGIAEPRNAERAEPRGVPLAWGESRSRCEALLEATGD